MKQTPISDSGIVTIGISTERNEPRKRKMTTTTMSDRLADGLEHLLDRGADRLGRVVDELDRHALRQGRPGSPAVFADRRRRRSSGLAAGVGKMPMKMPSLAVEADARIGRSRRRARPGDIAQTDDVVAVCAHRQCAESLRRLQRRSASRSNRRRIRSCVLPGADRKLRAADCGKHVGGGDVARRERDRIDPDAHREFARAEDLGIGDAFHRRRSAAG